MGFVQDAEVRKMSIKEIKQNVDEEPKKNIVSIITIYNKHFNMGANISPFIQGGE